MALAGSYLVDSAFLAEVNGRSDSNTVWTIIEGLISDGKMFVLTETMKELRAVDSIAAKRLNPHSHFKLTANDYDYNEAFSYAGEFLENNEELVARLSVRDQQNKAMMIGVCWAEKMLLVSGERFRKGMLPKLAGELGWDCDSLDEIIARHYNDYIV